MCSSREDSVLNAASPSISAIAQLSKERLRLRVELSKQCRLIKAHLDLDLSPLLLFFSAIYAHCVIAVKNLFEDLLQLWCCHLSGVPVFTFILLDYQ